jgi:hypothetical protein
MIPRIDPADVDPTCLCPTMLPDLDDGLSIDGCRGDKSVFRDVEESSKDRGCFNDQSEGSLCEDTLVRDSDMIDENGVRKLEDDGDGYCGYGIDFPGPERRLGVNPDEAEGLIRLPRVGYCGLWEKTGISLCVSSNSGSSRAKDLGIGTGDLGGVKSIASMTEYITYMDALDVSFECVHEFLTLKDGI